MTQTLITPSIIAKEGLFQLMNNLVMAKLVHREYKKEFVKVGGTVSLRKPVRFVSTSGATLTKQDVEEGTTSIVISTRKHVGWGFLSEDLTLTVEQYAERYMEPAGIRLGNDVDLSLTGLYSSLFVSGGTPGSTPSSFAALGTMAQYLDDFAVPDDGKRKLVLNPASRWSMADALKGIYDNSMPKDFVRRGLLGRLANFEIYGDQNIGSHTCGARVDDAAILIDNGTLNSNSSPQANTITMHMDGFGGDTANSLRVGDVCTIADVYSVNPVSKQSTGRLMQFTVTTAVTPAGNESDVILAPALVSTGPYQNVSAAAVDGAAVTFLGTNSTVFPQNLAFHRNALALVMCPLALPDGASFKARTQHDGVSIRVVKDFSIVDDEDIIRLDILYGVKAIYPELGGRLWG